jgi:hypothetical protein
VEFASNGRAMSYPSPHLGPERIREALDALRLWHKGNETRTSFLGVRWVARPRPVQFPTKMGNWS